MNRNRNSTRHYSFTILIPLFNEEDNIIPLEKRLQLFLPQSLYPTCVVFINDGSLDDSLSRIYEVCMRNRHFFYISLEKNGGLSAALKAGIDYTFSDYLGSSLSLSFSFSQAIINKSELIRSKLIVFNR